jgi:asparagine synthase (glutamine-hydrolysing)
MCGIFGYFSNASEQIIRNEHLENISYALHHRGPDDINIHRSKGSCIGILRYRVVGTESGSQPIVSESGKTIVVYNGEIFNHLELRRILASHGRFPPEDSDGSVLADLYEEFGPKCFSMINGDFAIAVHNLANDTLVLARDRFGVRPLYFQKDGEALTFSSEAKGVPNITGDLPTMDRVNLGTFALCGFMLNPMSLFENVEQLPIASYATFKHGNLKVHRYWDFPFLCDNKPKKGTLDRELVSELLEDSVKLRLQADLPVGVFLSSGLDSSLIAFLAKRHLPRLDAFTLRFQDQGYDESESAAEFARDAGLDHHILEYTNRHAVELFPKLIFHTESIINSGGPMAFYALAKFAKEKVGVVLGGEGADEVFHGYGFHRAQKRLELLRKGGLDPSRGLGHALARSMGLKEESVPGNKVLSRVNSLFGRDSLGLRYFAQKGLTLFNELGIIDVTESDCIARIRSASDSKFTRATSLDLADFETLVDFETWLENHLLVVNGDRASMAATLEVRYPFLDHRLVDYIQSLPPSERVSLTIDKTILRNLRIEGFPKKFLRRGKNPFLAPAGRPFFDSTLRNQFPYIDRMTSIETTKEKGYFDALVVERIIENLSTAYNSPKYSKKSSYGHVHFLESIFLTVLSVHLWDDLFVRGNSLSEYTISDSIF